MPIYEYQCQACQHQLEALQKMNDEPLLECPTCGESQLKKKISAVAFRLKGSGWYETDFKTGDKKNIAGDTSGSKSADSTKSGEGSKSSGDGKSSTAEKHRRRTPPAVRECVNHAGKRKTVRNGLEKSPLTGQNSC